MQVGVGSKRKRCDLSKVLFTSSFKQLLLGKTFEIHEAKEFCLQEETAYAYETTFGFNQKADHTFIVTAALNRNN